MSRPAIIPAGSWPRRMCAWLKDDLDKAILPTDLTGHGDVAEDL
jgi:hypothetical protein